jgi:3-oxoacyl-[acyl-carrier-protein] synthase II
VIESRDGRRVVVTGVGVVACCGTDRADFWAGLAKPPRSAVLRMVADFDPARRGLDHLTIRRLDRFGQFAVAAAAEALDDAGLLAGPTAVGPPPGMSSERAGVVFGTGVGGAMAWEPQALVLRDKGARHVSALTVPRVMPNSAAAAVSMRWRLAGACETVSTACAAGTHAIGAAARLIASGRLDVAVAGGAEACLTDTNVAAFTNMKALSPTGCARPFDAGRDGFCAAEGSAVVVLEELRHARARGAFGYCELAGTGSTADAYHLTAPAPDGAGARRCMELALADAGLPATEVSHINAHGTATQPGDATEARAIAAVFGSSPPAVTSVKGVLGHALGAAGALEAVAVALTYANREIPPTAGTRTVDPALDLDLVLEPRPWEPGVALSNSFAFGGHNGVLVFGPAP